MLIVGAILNKKLTDFIKLKGYNPIWISFFIAMIGGIGTVIWKFFIGGEFKAWLLLAAPVFWAGAIGTYEITKKLPKDSVIKKLF
ncbi:MAG: hypothetical protein GY870_11260 [archaeon]|nr:hypothetical protein [archaeon]